MLSDPSDRPLQIVVADADAQARSRFATALEEAGHLVHLAGDGEEALAKTHDERPDIVFLDAHLPVQGGWLVCAKLKLRSDAPMVVMMIDEAAEESVADAGHPHRFAAFVQADELLPKPIDAEHALRMLRERTADVG